ncbi:MAG TPA: hypothetical protein VM033_01380 [Gemmatimonadaceae bacterium]|nr:hypothetical protein [Gemmatimonadaceae bacterium]
MSPTVRPLHPRPALDPRHRVGELIADLAHRYAGQMNGCEFAAQLRSRRVERRRYIAFVSSLYPCVIGFNRALIRSISKVDHVVHGGFVKALAEQLEEEQVHNQMWRTKLDVYGVDHEALYWDLTDYLARFSPAELERMTREVLLALTRDPEDVAPGAFPDAPFPEPVIALYHHLWMSASYDDIDYWEHFASQCAVEMVIYNVVSNTVLPGVKGNPELDSGPATLRWWTEHARADVAEPHVKSDEEKHLEISRIALNRSETANSLRDVVLARAEETLRLFAATLTCQSTLSQQFPLERYFERGARRTGTN